jgi:hypothetical protein
MMGSPFRVNKETDSKEAIPSVKSANAEDTFHPLLILKSLRVCSSLRTRAGVKSRRRPMIRSLIPSVINSIAYSFRLHCTRHIKHPGSLVRQRKQKWDPQKET